MSKAATLEIAADRSHFAEIPATTTSTCSTLVSYEYIPDVVAARRPTYMASSRVVHALLAR